MPSIVCPVAARALHYLSSSTANKEEVLKAGAVAPLVEALRTPKKSTRVEAALALQKLSMNGNSDVAVTQAAESIEELVELLRSGSNEGRIAAAGV